MLFSYKKSLSSLYTKDAIQEQFLNGILIYISGAIRRSTLPVSLSYHGRFL